MSQEQIQSVIEKSDQLFEDIFSFERGTLPVEHLPMWDAENNACFPHFVDYSKEVLSDVFELAKSGDKESITILHDEYKVFRDNLEAELKENFPEVYDLFIEAVVRGDAINASIFIEECIERISETKKEEEEDDDDEI